MIAGQSSIFDLIEAPAAPALRFGWCPACHTCWIEIPRTAEWIARRDSEHALQDDGRCAAMHVSGNTEPYYTIAEIKTQVFADGGVIQYPRPQGFGGFYQLRKAS